MIGALHYETQVAQAAAEQVGIHSLSASEMTVGGFTTIALLMSVCIMWGMVLSIFFNKRYLNRLRGGKAASSSGFGDKAMTAMFIGLICAYIGSYIGGFLSGGGLLTFSGDWTPLGDGSSFRAGYGSVSLFLREKRSGVAGKLFYCRKYDPGHGCGGTGAFVQLKGESSYE